VALIQSSDAYSYTSMAIWYQQASRQKLLILQIDGWTCLLGATLATSLLCSLAARLERATRGLAAHGGDLPLWSPVSLPCPCTRTKLSLTCLSASMEAKPLLWLDWPPFWAAAWTSSLGLNRGNQSMSSCETTDALPVGEVAGVLVVCHCDRVDRSLTEKVKVDCLTDC
jgi:hypothetical protein